jgi:outer membrane lipoprotein-sorting protein
VQVKFILVLCLLMILSACSQQSHYQIKTAKQQINTYRMDLSDVNDPRSNFVRPRHYEGVRSYGNDNITLFQTDASGRINTISIGRGLSR